jgi:putative inorganic carbon (HCO3(-)) transporter
VVKCRPMKPNGPHWLLKRSMLTYFGLRKKSSDSQTLVPEPQYWNMVLSDESALRRTAFCLTLASAVAPLVSIAASHTLLAASFVCLLLMREKLRFPPIKLPLLLFFGGTVLSLFLSGYVVAGWPQVRKFYVFFLVLVSITTVFRELDHVLALVMWWVGAATCSAIWGLVQFGQRFQAANRLGGNLYHELVLHRITGFMSLWMTFSGELVVVLLMLGAYLLFAPERRRHWPLLGGCGLVMVLALVLALTRGPWIGAAAGAVYLLWQWNRKSLLVLPVLAILAFLAAPTLVRQRVASLARPRSELDSNQHRVVVWRTGLEMVKAHPWFGLGPEQVKKQFDRYIPADIPRPLPWGWYGHLHNIYLQYAAERGIPVLLVFLWLVGKVFLDFRRAVARAAPGLGNRRAILHGCIAAFIAVMVGGLFEHNLGDSEVLQIFLTVIAIGYVASWTEQAKPSDRRVAGSSPA